MKRFLVAALLLAIPAHAVEPPDMAVRGFYDAYLKMRDDTGYGGLPDARHLVALRPALSEKLYAALDAAGAAELRYVAATKGQVPPLVEGDPFSALFEGASTFYINGCETKGEAALCTVTLTHREKEVQDVTWRDTLDLVSENGNWKVDDIAYGGTWDFGNKGTLRAMLAAVVKDSKAGAN